MKTNLAALCSLALLACATARVTPELLSARAAYQAAQDGPAGQMNPADVYEAKVLLDQAENAASGPDVDLARHRAYLAQRRAELASAQGRTSAATSEKAKSMQQIAALKDQSLATARSDLVQANAAQAQTQTDLSQTQRQLDAEHQSRVEMHGQLAAAAASQQRTQDQLSRSEDRVDAEHQARLAAEQDTLDALGKIAAVRKEARGTVITLNGNVLFASGDSGLLPAAQRQIDQVAEALMPGDRTVLVEGHTDSTGSDASNLQLSRTRAEAVMGRLVSHGVRQSRVRAMGMGSSRPLANNVSAQGRAVNRRVEIVIEAPKTASSN